MRQKTGAAATGWQRGYTLIEMMTTMGVFSMVVMGLVYAHLFGLKQDELVQSKLGASDQARRSFDLLTTDVRSAKSWQIGTSTGVGNFTACASNTNQAGNAVKLSPTGSSSSYVVYFFDRVNGQLERTVNGSATSTVIAQYLTNISDCAFYVEDYKGVRYSNTPPQKAILRTFMQFYQFQYPLTQVGTNKMYDSYTTEFRITCHAPDGA